MPHFVHVYLDSDYRIFLVRTLCFSSSGFGVFILQAKLNVRCVQSGRKDVILHMQPSAIFFYYTMRKLINTLPRIHPPMHHRRQTTLKPQRVKYNRLKRQRKKKKQCR